MKNNLTHQKSIDSLKRVFFSKNCIPVYYILGAMFVFLNVILLPGLFQPGNEYLDTDFSYIIFLVFASFGILFLTYIMAPICLKKKDTQANDENEQTAPAFVKILSLWITVCVCMVVQMLIFGICTILSKYFDLPFINILLACLSLCVLYLVWIILFSLLYFCTRSVSWYVTGFFVFNFAPIIISRGCYDIYNLNPVVPNLDWNFLQFNLFTLSAIFCFNPIIMILMAVIAIGILMCMWWLWKKHCTINFSVISSIYKMITVVLVSLSCGFMFSYSCMDEAKISQTYIIRFLIVALVVAAATAFIVFRKNKMLLHTGIAVLVVAISSALILGGIPARTHKAAYYLPKPEKIESVNLFLSSTYELEIKEEHFDEVVDLHTQNIKACGIDLRQIII